jgi:hypothetical protein
MTIQYKSGRQFPLVAVLDITYADVAGIATAMNAIEVPANAIVIGGDITVTTAWNTTGTATIDLGDAADDDRYTASAISLKSAARTALTLTGYKHTVAAAPDPGGTYWGGILPPLF